MAMVYGYGRHSTDKQGLTEGAQRDKVMSYIQHHLPEHTSGGWLYDSATSGKRPLFERDTGRELWALVQPGDHIVWAKLDRAFRSVVDGAGTLAMLAAKGVYVHSLDLGLDTSTAVGRCVCTVMLAFAELEREYASERTREALHHKKKKGLPYNAGVPIGWKKVGSGSAGRFVPDQDERDQAYQIVGLRAVNMSYDSIVAFLRNSRRPNGRQWNRNTVRWAEMAAQSDFPKVLTAELELSSSVP